MCTVPSTSVQMLWPTCKAPLPPATLAGAFFLWSKQAQWHFTAKPGLSAQSCPACRPVPQGHVGSACPALSSFPNHLAHTAYDPVTSTPDHFLTNKPGRDCIEKAGSHRSCVRTAGTLWGWRGRSAPLFMSPSASRVGRDSSHVLWPISKVTAMGFQTHSRVHFGPKQREQAGSIRHCYMHLPPLPRATLAQ